MTATGPRPSALPDEGDLIDAILRPRPGPFAVIHRPAATGPDTLEVLLGGAINKVATLADIPLPDATDDRARHHCLVLVPFRQIAERGFEAVDDGAPLLAMPVDHQSQVPLAQFMARVADRPIAVANQRLEPEDAEYERIVRSVIDDSIGTGEGANFVIRRSFTLEIRDYTPAMALVFFRRLLQQERGAYWTFVVHTGDRTFVGASPERHVSLEGAVAVMNPISGTYRYPPGGPEISGVMTFLADKKETEELYMVLDEELKMMARISPDGGRVVGPFLKEMTHVAHTEYLIEAATDRDLRDVLHETLFAPTVTGSPLESACRVIARHEPEGRGYYAGVVALLGADGHGRQQMDSAILIRTAEIDAAGHTSIGVGATLVRHSDPAAEAAETRAKASGLLAALADPAPRLVAAWPAVQAALAGRNDGIAQFWLRSALQRAAPDGELIGREVLVVDAEDTFTSMISHQLRALGLKVQVRRFDEDYQVENHDLVLMGPGPGDPQSPNDPKIKQLRSDLRTLLDRKRPFIAVCLSHQVLAGMLGLPIERLTSPRQGAQLSIDLFGEPARVGFYNTFCARSDQAALNLPGAIRVEVCRDAATRQVHALRGPRFASMQFHPESILTQAGPRIVARMIRHALDLPATTATPEDASILRSVGAA